MVRKKKIVQQDLIIYTGENLDEDIKREICKWQWDLEIFNTTCCSMYMYLFDCLFHFFFLVWVVIGEVAKEGLNDSPISERNLITTWGLRWRWKE